MEADTFAEGGALDVGQGFEACRRASPPRSMAIGVPRKRISSDGLREFAANRLWQLRRGLVRDFWVDAQPPKALGGVRAQARHHRGCGHHDQGHRGDREKDQMHRRGQQYRSRVVGVADA